MLNLSKIGGVILAVFVHIKYMRNVSPYVSEKFQFLHVGVLEFHENFARMH